MITIKTNHGDIGVELFDDKAPISCENFRQYITDGHFNGTIFHRVIPNFMIQGGGMDESMSQKPTREPIKNEADNGLSNARGSIAMARTSDPDSATAQFFINVHDNKSLNYRAADPQGIGYTVFGQVVTVAGGSNVDFAGAEVVLSNGLGDLRTLLSADDPIGKYTFSDVPPGSYTLSARREGALASVVSITVSPGIDVEQDLVLAAQASITGTIAPSSADCSLVARLYVAEEFGTEPVDEVVIIGNE